MIDDISPLGSSKKMDIIEDIRKYLEKFFELLLPFILAGFFAIELADLNQYAEDHNFTLIWLEIVALIAFLLIYNCIILRIAQYVISKIHLDKKIESNQVLWLVGNIAIGLVAFSINWIFWQHLIISNYAPANMGERAVFEHDVKWWLFSIFLFNFFISNSKLSTMLSGFICSCPWIKRRPNNRFHQEIKK